MKEYAIGYLAQRTDLAVSAIRHYESQGLIKLNRTTSGQRRFARSDIRRLSFIKIAQKTWIQFALYPRPAGQLARPSDPVSSRLGPYFEEF